MLPVQSLHFIAPLSIPLGGAFLIPHAAHAGQHFANDKDQWPSNLSSAPPPGP